MKTSSFEKNYRDQHKLDKFYDYIKNTILPYQSAELGLFGDFELNYDYGSVRENVYCVISLWAASLAYKFVDDITGRSYELEHCAIKCMRAILYCWMYEVDKIEEFKKNPSGGVSPSCVFHLKTGKPLITENSAQIDCYALYILILAQMTASGFIVIYTKDEVSLVQNLIFTIERTYRTTDYGVWGTGSRFSHCRELNSSSVGLAKAALEAANGINLLGPNGDRSSTLYSDPDAHHQNSVVLNSFLPRESFSKLVDAYLLAVCGFPGFAVDSMRKQHDTFAIIEKELKGRMGYRRYPLDSHGVAILNSSSNQPPIDIRMLNGIECEWPVFYVYQGINAYYSGDVKRLEDAQKKIKKLLVLSSEGYKVLPKYYHVTPPDSDVKPVLKNRQPYPKDDRIFLWGQSLYITWKLLRNRIIQPSSLDPLCRHSFEYNNFATCSFSNRQPFLKKFNKNTVIQVCLLSESEQLQKSLSTYGVITQNLLEIEPAIVCHPDQLITTFAMLGKNERLGFSGRPNRPFGVLNCCKVFHFFDKILLTHPLSLHESSFYLSNDVDMIIKLLLANIQFVSTGWNMLGRPTFFLVLKSDHFSDVKFNKMMKFLYDLKNNRIPGVKIRIDKFQHLLKTACNEYLEFVSLSAVTAIRNSSLSESSDEKNDSSTKSEQGRRVSRTLSTRVSPRFSLQKQMSMDITHSLTDIQNTIDDMASASYVPTLEKEDSYRVKLVLLRKLQKKFGSGGVLYYISKSNSTVHEEVVSCRKTALLLNDWSAIRYSSGLLDHVVDSLAPSVSSILVSQKILVIGSPEYKEYMVTDPLPPKEIYAMLREHTIINDPRLLSLQQELIVNVCNLMRSSPEYFANISKIRIGWICKAIQSYIQWVDEARLGVQGDTLGEKVDLGLYSMPPSELYEHMAKLISTEDSIEFGSDKLGLNNYQRRLIDGAFCRVPPNFYRRVWRILQATPKGIKLFDDFLPQLPTIHIMTPDEINFNILVEVLLSNIREPIERQLCVELITVLAILLERSPEIEFRETLCLNELISDAQNIYSNDAPSSNTASTDLAFPTNDSSPQTKIPFTSLPPKIMGGTAFYMSRAVASKFINGFMFVSGAEKSCNVT